MLENQESICDERFAPLFFQLGLYYLDYAKNYTHAVEYFELAKTILLGFSQDEIQLHNVQLYLAKAYTFLGKEEANALIKTLRTKSLSNEQHFRLIMEEHLLLRRKKEADARAEKIAWHETVDTKQAAINQFTRENLALEKTLFVSIPTQTFTHPTTTAMVHSTSPQSRTTLPAKLSPVSPQVGIFSGSGSDSADSMKYFMSPK